MQGPNVRKLICHKFSIDAIPSNGGVADGIRVLTSPGKLQAGIRAATEWVNTAIALVKQAPDNPFGDDDEAIAGEILRQIEERKKRP